MYWNVSSEIVKNASEEPAQGRFVLHRHRDNLGAHLDLRLEEEGHLSGFRIESSQLVEGGAASEKAPHPKLWLDSDGDAVREDAGTYRWIEKDKDHGVLELRGQSEVHKITLSRVQQISAQVIRELSDSCRNLELIPEHMPGLLQDGVTARNRALERFCALGRELDGNSFEEKVWRKTLSKLSLEEIHAHLRTYEVRFDLKYPPSPVSKAETLTEEESGERTQQVLSITRG